jgi:hypothetical protein
MADVYAMSNGMQRLTALCGVEVALKLANDAVDLVRWSVTCVANMLFVVRMEFVVASLTGMTKAPVVSTSGSALPYVEISSVPDRVVKTAENEKPTLSVMIRANVFASPIGVRLAASSTWVAAITAV